MATKYVEFTVPVCRSCFVWFDTRDDSGHTVDYMLARERFIETEFQGLALFTVTISPDDCDCTWDTGADTDHDNGDWDSHHYLGNRGCALCGDYYRVSDVCDCRIECIELAA